LPFKISLISKRLLTLYGNCFAMLSRFLFTALLIACCSQCLVAQRCGEALYKQAVIARNPAAADSFTRQLQQQRSLISYYHAHPGEVGARTFSSDTTYPIPVVFHFLIDSAQFYELGGIDGIEARVNAQIDVLNQDFNRANADSIGICSCFKPLYSSAGIRFALADSTPAGTFSLGYEIRIVSGGNFCCVGTSYDSAKHTSLGGLDAWDVTRYVNIWCTGFRDYSTLLGLTVSHFLAGTDGRPANEIGICALYNAVGRRASASDSYPGGTEFDEGRTITHEMGHMFEIWHPWGDDGGACPWDGGSDDGIADTPPQGDALSGGGFPCPHTDGCKDSAGVDMQPCGVIVNDFMQYVDDSVMHMFTHDQVIVMDSKVITAAGESHSLTEHPGITKSASIASLPGVAGVKLFPNPTTAILNIVCDKERLRSIEVYNLLGQEVKNMVYAQPANHAALDLSEAPKGLYIVRCNFTGASVTSKVLLQ
jgi:Secretion system C-terminal sorting domain/Pregnancy-associated plasma protein-A